MVSKTGNSVIIETPSGTQYSRNTSHVEKFGIDDAASTFKTLSVSQMKLEHLQQNQVELQLILMAPTTLLREPPSKNTPLTQVCGMETRQFPSVQILQLMEQQCLACKQHQAVKDLRDRGGH